MNEPSSVNALYRNRLGKYTFNTIGLQKWYFPRKHTPQREKIIARNGKLTKSNFIKSKSEESEWRTLNPTYRISSLHRNVAF